MYENTCYCLSNFSSVFTTELKAIEMSFKYAIKANRCENFLI